VESLFRSIDAAVNWLTKPEILITGMVVVLLASMKWARIWTRTPVVLAIAVFGLVGFVYSFLDWPGVSHQSFRDSMTKADNIPIAMIVATLFFFYWLSLKKAVENDERAKRGDPPLEAVEKNRKVLVWPDLVYTELIAMVACTVFLLLWSIYIKAPIEEPANAARTPNPSKAPWYFLGLQELLVYFDPWLAGVAVPGTIILGLVVIPYVDRNPKGNGYFTLDERKMAIFVFLFGFFVLWVAQMFIGTFLRGPGWNFFGLYETWDVRKVEDLGNIDVSEIFYVNMLGRPVEPEHWLPRELPGILLVLGYLTVFPLVIARTVGRKMFRELGAIRFGIVINLALVMLAVPLKMIARWLFNLKYVVNLDEILLNI
jgi:hypothetical protein